MHSMRAGLIAALLGMVLLSAAQGETTDVRVYADTQITTVPEGIFSVGYNGWGDITRASAVEALNQIGVRFCRIDVDLKEICGEQFGDFRWEYTVPRDLEVGFVSRVKTILDNGWTPILAFSTCRSMPAWFHGTPQGEGKDWFRYNADGSLDPNGSGDQFEEFGRVAGAIAAGLAEQGLTGLHWETIYELGAEMPLADLHYYAANGIREADPTATLIGPATWPGWTVRERFLKPYLSKYGPDLLDIVSVHWYATCDHSMWDAGFKPEQTILTMADRLYLTYGMEIARQYADWCRELRELLDDPALNPAGKRIGIAFTEYDLNAYSPYMKNPENPDWPEYRADADCYVNTNYFGGVWCAEVMCSTAASGCADIMAKFNTRQYYGIIDNRPDGEFMRQPIWFAWRLLVDTARMRPGEAMLRTRVRGPSDNAVEHLKHTENSPWVSAYALGGPDDLRLVLINRCFDAQTVNLDVAGLSAGRPSTALRYLFNEDRVARFIGREPGSKVEGHFEGYPDDAASMKCLEPVGEVSLERVGGRVRAHGLQCPPVSMTILVLQNGS